MKLSLKGKGEVKACVCRPRFNKMAFWKRKRCFGEHVVLTKEVFCSENPPVPNLGNTGASLGQVLHFWSKSQDRLLGLKRNMSPTGASTSGRCRLLGDYMVSLVKTRTTCPEHVGVGGIGSFAAVVKSLAKSPLCQAC